MNMNKFYSICMVAFSLLGLFACKDDTRLSGTEEGTLQLTVGMSDKVTVVSRSLSSSDEAELENDCKIRIYSGSTLVRKYQGVENIPATIPLSGGNYSVRVTAGDSVSASFEKRFFEGVKSFVIGGGEETKVNVICGIANTVVSHTWDESLKEVFDSTSYQVKVISANDSLVFSSNKLDAKGYFSLPDNDRKLTFKFSATKKGGEKYEVVKKMESAQAATLYNLTWKCNPEEQTTGGAMLVVTVDDTPLIENPIYIYLPQRPVVKCIDADNIEYDLEQYVYMESETNKMYSLVISTSSPLTSALLQNSQFIDFDVPVNNIEMMKLTDTEKNRLSAAGITMFSPDIISEKGGTWRIDFSGDLIQKMTTKEGEVHTSLTVTDENNKQRTVTWTIMVSDATVVTNEIPPGDVWTSKATLCGTVVSETGLKDKAQFRYREESSDSWITVDADKLSNGKISKEITGLKPGTTYEYQAMDGVQASPASYKFTTDIEFQPENASFEYTQILQVPGALIGTVDCLFFYKEGDEMWWDTGNTGSVKGGQNITTQDSSIKNSGTYSVKLASTKIFGTFAAGNLFTGRFLGTEDTTKGILGWGRPCTSRPTALKVWVRYMPGIVDKGGDHIKNGDTDKGIIYVAVGDWKSSDKDYGTEWPVVVRTKGPVLFNPHDENTIGYGEYIFTENYGTETGLKEITIPLDYEEYGGYNKKPESIIIVASASQYGDYYEGSSSSVMWLDDMELIYE